MTILEVRTPRVPARVRCRGRWRLYWLVAVGGLAFGIFSFAAGTSYEPFADRMRSRIYARISSFPASSRLGE